MHKITNTVKPLWPLLTDGRCLEFNIGPIGRYRQGGNFSVVISGLIVTPI
jgi:hypothetical protein